MQQDYPKNKLNNSEDEHKLRNSDYRNRICTVTDIRNKEPKIIINQIPKSL